MQRNFQIIGVVILIALAGVTLFKLYQEPVSDQIIYLVIAILVAVFILLGLKPKSVKYKDFQIEIDHDTGKRLDDVTIINPYGEQQILLNGQKLQVVAATLDAIAFSDYIVNKKYGFALAKPNPALAMQSQLMPTVEYIKSYEDSNFDNHLLDIPIIRESKIFRIWHSQPIDIEFVKPSHIGEYISDKEFKDYCRYLKRDERLIELRNVAKQTLLGFSYKQFNELAIMVCPRKIVEASLIVETMGRKVELTPLNYVMHFGGLPPKLDTVHVKQASISHDGNVWGFYGETSIHNVYADKHEQTIMYYDFYKIFVINKSYIYQISLSYVPSMKHPRATWDELARLLQSLRIVVA